MSAPCENCEEYLPGGCHHIYGHQKQCPLGKRTDAVWLAGKAAWDVISDRGGFGLKGLKHGNTAEIIEAMGRAALAAIAKDGGVA